MGLVGDLSSARLRDELEALLEEGDVEHSILRLAELGAASAIHPHLAADDEAVALLRRLIELRDRYGLEIPAWRLGLAALARKLPPDEVYDWLQRLKVRRRDAEQVAAAVTVGPGSVERLAGRRRARRGGRRSPSRTRPTRRCSRSRSPTAEPLHAYFDRLRDVRLEVSGADLAELGLGESPRVGEILAELRRRKLNGELDGRESELAAARELIERLKLFRWEVPGPYEVVFTTREGGVSDGPFESLNLGLHDRRRPGRRRGEPAARLRGARAPIPTRSR